MSAFSSNEHIKDREKKYSKNFQFLKQKIELKKKIPKGCQQQNLKLKKIAQFAHNCSCFASNNYYYFYFYTNCFILVLC
jgi:hypothetical protein